MNKDRHSWNNQEEFISIKILVIGDHYTGKSTFLEHYCQST
jgi:GTPase SAR1 family protein